MQEQKELGLCMDFVGESHLQPTLTTITVSSLAKMSVIQLLRKHMDCN